MTKAPSDHSGRPAASGKALPPASENPGAARRSEGLKRRRRSSAQQAAASDIANYAALDLGTNNCRLMIASFQNGQFKIVEAFSRIVRLGEGVSSTGNLQPAAMERAMASLRQCAEKIKRRNVVKIRAVATQACRAAGNGADFIARVERETGLKLTIITPEEEARLAVVGCASLLDTPAKAAIVMDVGGGSTEISWLDLSQYTPPKDIATTGNLKLIKNHPLPKCWLSIPKGVVNLAERFPEPKDGDPKVWFQAMVADVQAELEKFRDADGMTEHFFNGETYMIGTSGAITSLAGMHLGLERYDRSRVDGLWMTHDDCKAVINRLLELGQKGREYEPCIGKDRADLVLAGAALLEAVQNLWPSQRLRVADRGLREGLLLSMIKKKTRRRRRRKPGAHKTT
ncbi:Ppx/GppA phosphatase family protein [Asticcacaulis sp. ZE23SCel15]|uniref:Ppx/GppA phosphatase family protein n=1 Tax=Asticcacaulis sp. ZE23SCel15 TaxID=3059027 RepID=UPI00265F92CD|nr:Ppx/GppA phosphatase family protein [Asticcacaulis sp. ZE23SCel15]WKL56329.1 Ppx/GppA phosphatase family protein [Asticcacaulis sp. ZE23SCel15]